MEHPQKEEKFYCRVPGHGFGDGLILSEVSEEITQEAFTRLLGFLKEKALERHKPYIRLNLHNGSSGAKMAIAMGAKKGRPYAWQIKIPDRKKILERITPVLDRRIENSVFRNYAGELRLELFQESIDIKWDAGRIRRIAKGNPAEEKGNVFCIPPDLFPPLCMGYRTWLELQFNRPDIFPANQYIRMKSRITPDETGLLAGVLFPSTRSWVYEQY
ncbi:MAG: hypothetical protein GY846_09730 [Deltaproteobacteria bacterium]|nr:hypothetical protein [Deltaproteobacteria bacterium]